MKLEPTKVRRDSKMVAEDKVDPFFQLMESGMTTDEICKK